MSYHKLLLVTAAAFGVVGVFMGGHMAGSGGPALRPIHAHVLVVGWLTLAVWSMYYKVYRPAPGKLAFFQVWSGIIGTIGLCTGMYVFMLSPFNLPELFTLLYYIISGSILMISFFLFFIMALKTPDNETA
ncbi:hypothetical protein [Alkalicoccus urumqiensis]|uniref:Cytochrome-c oxidase n=1 Tax=Alkalicoccus urumqiensis TaxID=1548213 RepID=A0A2P6MI45_ALKUR|nr:hypothetical protein [Alkalicoccus urumqiensis]PRO65928.1 hypothetical protein C6I21_06390 [Alkalicoccus urumqiensis]